eukprot:TRINITY_DN35778_c0_g1_i1.p1 TRINITY_DN35778_c0_g1~~TRINITY_DN35778_c0_g1_i1.p1  ORF type:complete len:304 (-),score=75.25 TRINITY_DN35778_c0_g1_i1:254-1165(-)
MALRIAFIGLGEMGGRMMPHLVKAGHKVTAFDTSSERMQAAASAGAHPASTPSDAIDGSDVVLTMLPSIAAVDSVYRTSVFPSLTQDAKTLLIDASTTGPECPATLAGEAASCAPFATFVDAPVSGGVAAAAAGNLTFMVGGAEDGFLRAKPILEPMGKKIFHAGARVGDGQIAKLCNNAILGAHMAAVSEALLMGTRHGVDAKVMSDIFATTTAACWSITVQNPIPGVKPDAPSSRGYTGGFGSSLMLKDLKLARGATKGLSTPVLDSVHELYSKVCEHDDLGGRDFSSVAKYLEETSAKAK